VYRIHPITRFSILVLERTEHWYEIIYLLIASRNKQKVHLNLVTEPLLFER